MEKQSKRKATESPGAGQNPSTSRTNKTRKLNSPERQQDDMSLLSHEGPKGSDFTQKLVSMWLGGSKGHDSLLTQGVQESITLRETQQKLAEAEGYIQKIQQKVESAETHISALTQDFHSEKKTNTDLMAKINAMAEMVSTITEHINYAVDTLERCRQHKDHLSNLYNNVILRQREQLKKLQIREETFNKQIVDLQKEKDANLASVAAECKLVEKKLEEVIKEKEEISRASLMKEMRNSDYEKKISEYEIEINNLAAQSDRVSADLDIIKNENTQLKNDLISKNNEVLQLSKDFVSVRSENELELSMMQNKNLELEEKLSAEHNERESLVKKLSEMTEQKNELNRQIEKLKDETFSGMREMKRRLENSEIEKNELREERKKKVDEMERKEKTSAEKYETLLTEMKTLDAHYQSELSRVNQSSSTAASDANAVQSRLESQIDSLRREKEECEVQLRRVENLLIMHTNSECQLRRKVEQYVSETAALTASVAKAAANEKIQDAKKQEDLQKISDLEKELLKLQFELTKSMQIEEKQGQTVQDATGQQGKVASSKQITAAVTYQKSILKRTPKPRKTRSKPPSLQLPSNKKISFVDFDSFSETRSVKPTNTSDTFVFLNSDDLFDEVAGTGNSSSQPLQAQSQNLSQDRTGGKKFFKSRNNR